MKVELLLPDTGGVASPATPDASGFGQAIDAIATVLDGATHAEDAYAGGIGSLQDAMYQRAQADIVLSVATAAAQRAGQAIQAVMNLQI